MGIKMKILSHADGTTPRDDTTIFVFGSNLAGRHGAGSAAVARQFFGADYGTGVGRTGRSYAIPTKDVKIQTLSLKEIEPYVEAFVDHAKRHDQDIFFLTRIGCGLAGYGDAEIAPMFGPALANCNYPKEWVPIIKRNSRS